MDIFSFSPNSLVPETVPRETSNVLSMNGWLFSARPGSKMQRRFRVKLHGLKWYLNSATFAYDATTNQSYNARALELFYEEHETWDPFLWTHPHLGQIVVRFAAPFTVPAAPPGSDGLVEPLEIELVEADLPLPPVFGTYSLAMNYVASDFWVDGTDYAGITATPGYTYTRTGTMKVVDIDGTIDTFAGNVIPINGLGYHAYPALTNLLIRSDELDNASWSKVNMTVTANNATGPDGTNTMEKLLPTAVAGEHYISGGITVAVATPHTYSIVVKPTGYDRVLLLMYGGTVTASADRYAAFYLNGSGTVTDTSAGVTATITALSNGYYRIAMRYTMASTGAVGCYLQVLNGPLYSDRSFTANGTGYILAGHAQVVAADYVNGGPMIPTTTAVASITTDGYHSTLANALGSSFTLWAKGTMTGIGDSTFFHISNTSTNYIRAYRFGNDLYISVRDSNIVMWTAKLAAVDFTVPVVIGVTRKDGVWRAFARYNGNNYDDLGTDAGSNTTPVPTGINEIYPGDNSASSGPLNGRLAGLYINPVGSTTAEILALLNAS